MITVSKKIEKIAYDLFVKASPGLSEEDIRNLRIKGQQALQKVRKNIDKEKKALKDLDDNEMLILLAYLVWIRQNVTTSKGDKSNDEDAARILHGEVYSLNGKKDMKEIKEQLVKQLNKVGIKVED